MHLPHLQPFATTPIYFFTAGVAGRRPILNCTIAADVLTGIWTASAEYNGWFVGRYMIMPDHVHFFATPCTDALSRADWHKLWKSLSARALCRDMKVSAPVWQADTFDHILRSPASYAEKWNYVLMNPVRKGLVAESHDWPWQGEIHSLCFPG